MSALPSSQHTHYPCYIERELVGFFHFSGNPGRAIRMIAAVPNDPFDSNVMLRTRSFEISRFGYQVDQLAIDGFGRSRVDRMDRAVRLLEDQGVPLGLMPIDVTQDACTAYYRLSWLGLKLTIEEHEWLFDQPKYFDREDKSALIYNPYAEATLRALNLWK